VCEERGRAGPLLNIASRKTCVIEKVRHVVGNVRQAPAVTVFTLLAICSFGTQIVCVWNKMLTEKRIRGLGGVWHELSLREANQNWAMKSFDAQDTRQRTSACRS
jgi:hypothetical protein